MGTEVTGIIKSISEAKQVSERFTKREFVLELMDNPKYPQLVLFQMTGDRCGQLDLAGVGDKVTAEYSLRGREWKSPSGDVKYFNTLDVWSLTVKDKAAPSSSGGDFGADDGIPFASCDIIHEPSALAKVLR